MWQQALGPADSHDHTSKGKVFNVTRGHKFQGPKGPDGTFVERDTLGALRHFAWIREHSRTSMMTFLTSYPPSRRP
ncbi:hypothetical protein AAY473_032517 [Plecturocebus cupreus]